VNLHSLIEEGGLVLDGLKWRSRYLFPWVKMVFLCYRIRASIMSATVIMCRVACSSVSTRYDELFMCSEKMHLI